MTDVIPAAKRKLFILYGRGRGALTRAQRKVKQYRSAVMACRAFSAYSLEDLQGKLRGSRPDIVFSSIHQIKDQSGNLHNVHAVLEQMHIPYVGSPPDVIDLAISKNALKTRWREAGILTPEFGIMRSQEEIESCLTELQLKAGFPFILKPDREGNSRGITEDSVVFSPSQFREKAPYLLKVYGTVLAEVFLGGCEDLREFTIAMIGNDRQLILPVEIQLLVQKDVRVVTTIDKDEHHTQAVPVTDPRLRSDLIAFASQAFLSAGVRDYARCDVLMAGGKFYAIEINGQPMLPDKWFDTCAAGGGLTQYAYLQIILQAALQRYPEK